MGLQRFPRGGWFWNTHLLLQETECVTVKKIEIDEFHVGDRNSKVTLIIGEWDERWWVSALETWKKKNRACINGRWKLWKIELFLTCYGKRFMSEVSFLGATHFPLNGYSQVSTILVQNIYYISMDFSYGTCEDGFGTCQSLVFEWFFLLLFFWPRGLA